MFKILYSVKSEVPERIFFSFANKVSLICSLILSSRIKTIAIVLFFLGDLSNAFQSKIFFLSLFFLLDHFFVYYIVSGYFKFSSLSFTFFLFSMDKHIHKLISFGQCSNKF